MEEEVKGKGEAERVIVCLLKNTDTFIINKTINRCMQFLIVYINSGSPASSSCFTDMVRSLHTLHPIAFVLGEPRTRGRG